MTRRVLTRGERNIRWIEENCRVPTGQHRGEYAHLTAEQRQTVRWMYDAPGGPVDVPVDDRALAAYLALLHLCGYEAPGTPDFLPRVDIDVFSLWAATSPEMRAVLKREGEAVICPELGKRFPWAA